MSIVLLLDCWLISANRPTLGLIQHDECVIADLNLETHWSRLDASAELVKADKASAELLKGAFIGPDYHL